MRPITQFGWAQACSGVAASSVSSAAVRNGPPEAVSTILRTAFAPEKHWKIALCSLSTGRICAPASRAAFVTSGPAMTRASLFARSTRLPALAAASVEARPAAPTMPAITAWQSACATTSSIAALPARSSVPASANFARKEDPPSERTA